MRDIRGRIAQRQGIDLSNQQIQDLAARRLESVLDPRAIKPSLLEGLRRSASTPVAADEKIPNEPTFSFEDTTLYDSHRGSLRFARRLLNPLLKLLFNPNPLIRALHLQAKLNVETAVRNAERDRRQTEWNALHFEIVQRMVTEVSRVSLELQALSMRVEALAARVDFNDRRVSTIEGSAQRARPVPRQPEPAPLVSQPSPVSPVAPVETTTAPTTAPLVGSTDSQTPDAARRRRRRRRGRRSGGGPGEFGASTNHGMATAPAGERDMGDGAPTSSEERRADAPEPRSEGDASPSEHPGPAWSPAPMHQDATPQPPASVPTDDGQHD